VIQEQSYALSGRKLKKLMRQHKITIADLKARTGITMKRIREVQKSGLTDRNAARDWVQAITGTDPGLQSTY
jgi:hypothetical protein